MQSTTCFHDGIANPILQEASLVFHHPVTLHPTDRVFDTDSDGRDYAIVCFLRWSELTPTWLFLRLDDADTVKPNARESPLLRAVTPTWPGITGQIREAFVMFLAFHSVTQKANVTGVLDYEEVFDRVTLLLAAVVVLLVLWIGGALDRSRSTIMPNRGDVGASFVCLVASSVAKASAVRAGSSSGGAKA